MDLRLFLDGGTGALTWCSTGWRFRKSNVTPSCTILALLHVEFIVIVFIWISLNFSTRHVIQSGFVSFAIGTSLSTIYGLLKALVFLILKSDDTPPELKSRTEFLEQELDSKDVNPEAEGEGSWSDDTEELLASHMWETAVTLFVLFAGHVEPLVFSSYDRAEAFGVSYWRVLWTEWNVVEPICVGLYELCGEYSLS